MVKVIATKQFHGSVVNRDDLGLVAERDTIEVSGNDAQYLEREGYARVVVQEESPNEPTESAAGNVGETPERARTSGTGEPST